jgi:hypothetical protein
VPIFRASLSLTFALFALTFSISFFVIFCFDL